MFKYHKNIVFLTITILGIFLIFSTSSWFIAWMGLEISLMAFTPLIISKNKDYSSESSLKYFLIQSIASTLILVSSALITSHEQISVILMFSSLTMKCGAAPFHSWFPVVIEGMDWPQTILLMTTQKIGPLSLLVWLNYNNFLLLTIATLSSVTGAISGLNELKMKKLLAFSSINHLCWTISSMTVSYTWWALYFIFYSLILISMVSMLMMTKTTHINQMKHLPTSSLMMLSVCLLSLGGLPPLLGFFPKMLVIMILVENHMMLFPVVFTIASVISLFYYCRILTSTFVCLEPKKSINLNNTMKYMALFNLLGLLFFTPMAF